MTIGDEKKNKNKIIKSSPFYQIVLVSLLFLPLLSGFIKLIANI